MRDLALPTINGIALCAGVGMLDEGLRAGFAHLGFDYRTVCYVEREAFAASQLVALMEAGCLDSAPVWNDLVTFDGGAWRGRVDCITAGFPCQPHSVAGKRAGLEDERWIWPDIARIIGDAGPRFVYLENVPGLVTTGGLSACLADLARLGFDAEWGTLSAADVGAAHRRERLFVMAYAGCEHQHLQQRLPRASEHPGSGGDLENPARDERDGSHWQGGSRRGVCEAGGTVADAESGRGGLGQRTEFEGRGKAESTGAELGDSEIVGRREGRPELPRRAGRSDPDRSSSTVADSSRPRSQGRELRGTRDPDRGGGQEAHGSVSELCGPFAPGPSDQQWPNILERFPFLAPATEPGLCGVVDGMALVVDKSRADQLRAIGNGVVPATAAAAFVQLARRAMT